MKDMRQWGVVVLAGAVAVLLALLAAPAGAQEAPVTTPATNPTAAPTFVVNSDPPGAVVILHGPYEWSGVTPWRLYRQVSGLYQAEVRRPGYETWKGEVVLGPGGVNSLEVKLSQKSGLRSFARSALVPGWGQIYRGQRLKGALLLTGTLAAAGAVIWTNEDYANKVDDFNAARRSYERATRLEDLPARFEVVRRASDKADRAYDRRRIALGALGGIYALNLLDAVFFGPSGEVSTSGTTGLSLQPAASDPVTIGWLADASSAGGVRAGLRLQWN